MARDQVARRQLEGVEADGRVEDAAVDAVDGQVLDVRVGVPAAFRRVLEAALRGDLVRVVVAEARLLVGPDDAELDVAVGVPLVGVGLVDEARGALAEGGVDALLPQVGGLVDVGVGRDEAVRGHGVGLAVEGDALQPGAGGDAGDAAALGHRAAVDLVDVGGEVDWRGGGDGRADAEGGHGRARRDELPDAVGRHARR